MSHSFFPFYASNTFSTSVFLQDQSLCERPGAELGARQPAAALPPESQQPGGKHPP